MGHFTTENIKLQDGTQVTITRYGVSTSSVTVFYLHGFPGSRIEGELATQAAEELDISLIAIDRPGFGGSSCLRGRKLGDFPSTLAAVADALSIPRFAILAVSGGAPYALVSALQLRDRVTNVGVVSGLGEVGSGATLRGMVLPNRVLLSFARVVPSFGFVLGWLLASWWSYFPSHLAIWFRLVLGQEDLILMKPARTRGVLLRNLREALKQGACSAARELLLLAQPWGADLSAIAAPVRFWHGERDRYVPVEFSQRSKSLIPNATLEIVPNAGHFMVLGMTSQVLQRVRQDFTSAVSPG